MHRVVSVRGARGAAVSHHNNNPSVRPLAMPDPMVGDRVQISGIGGRPQLNGMFGTVTGRAPNSRLIVRLENIESEVVSLNPAKLSTVGGGGSGGGGSRSVPATPPS